jgi:hypothetical protein
MDVPLIGVHLMDVPLIGVLLIGMHFVGVPLIGVPLMACISWTCLSEILVAYGAELHAKSARGATPLALAIGNGHEDMAELLLLAESIM